MAASLYYVKIGVAGKPSRNCLIVLDDSGKALDILEQCANKPYMNEIMRYHKKRMKRIHGVEKCFKLGWEIEHDISGLVKRLSASITGGD